MLFNCFVRASNRDARRQRETTLPIAPTVIRRDHRERHPFLEWVAHKGCQQIYLNPYQKDVMLRNHVLERQAAEVPRTARGDLRRPQGLALEDAGSRMKIGVVGGQCFGFSKCQQMVIGREKDGVGSH